jgi:hypothetical protein
MKPLEKLLSGDEIMEILNIKADKNLGFIIKETFGLNLFCHTWAKNT